MAPKMLAGENKSGKIIRVPNGKDRLSFSSIAASDGPTFCTKQRFGMMTCSMVASQQRTGNRAGCGYILTKRLGELYSGLGVGRGMVCGPRTRAADSSIVNPMKLRSGYLVDSS